VPVKTVEHSETVSQQIAVAHSSFSPTFEDAIDADRFDPLKSRIVQVGIVNHFPDLAHGSIANSETFR